MQKFYTDDVHYPDIGSASDWLKENSLAVQPIRSTTKIWVVHVISTKIISALVTQMSFCKGSSGNLAKGQLFSQSKGLSEIVLTVRNS